MKYKNKSYSENNEHYGSVALTDAQHETKLVKNYNQTLKSSLHYAQQFTSKHSFINAD